MIRAIVWTTISLMYLGASLLAGQEPPLDPAEGEIDGRTALGMYPVQAGPSEKMEILDSTGCRIYLLSRSTFETFEKPCGEWFLLPKDRYDYWAETEWMISPWASKLVYVGGPFQKRGMSTAVRLGPAGRVELPKGFRPSAGRELRVIQLNPTSNDGSLKRAITRRVPFAEMETGVAMPAGKALAAVWSARSSSYVRLSRPFAVAPGKTVQPKLEEPPADRTHLVLQIVRHTAEHEVAGDSLAVRLVDADGSEHAPDVRLATKEQVYAFFYDLPPTEVEIRVTAEGGRLDPVIVQLQPGTVERIVSRMAVRSPGADLTVEVDLPTSLQHGDSRLEVLGLPAEERVAERELKSDRWQYHFQDLPPGTFRVKLHTELGTFSRQVELVLGDVGYLHLAPELVSLTGQVSFGDEEHPAHLRFLSVTGETLETETDPGGRYEAVSLEPIRNVSIRLEGVDKEPFVSFFPDPIDGTREMDFEVPKQRFEVRVTDALSGFPIGGANVVTRNRYSRDADDGGDGVREEHDMSVMQASRTDEDGLAVLPPLREGQLEIRADAEGYLAMREPVEVEVLSDDDERRIDVVLEPAGSEVNLTLRLPSGDPAAEARVVVADVAGRSLLVRTADREGAVELPREGPAGAARVIVTHPKTAFLLRPWENFEEDTAPRWTLDAPSPRLGIRALDSSGETPVRHARIGLWIDGSFFADNLLHLLTRQPPRTDATGYWVAENLPLTPVGVVVWRSGEDNAATARLPSMAARLTPPWPDLVEIRALGE